MPDFREIRPESIADNTFKLIDKDWMLITAGTLESWNTMTASWGGFGILWHRPVSFCFVRPTRHTYEFMERAGRYTLSFFAEEWRDALNLCGTTSGRDTDKAAATGLRPVSGPSGAVWFEQARLVLDCRKLYFADLDPGHFLLPAIEEEYPKKDFHRLYIGEVERCLAR